MNFPRSKRALAGVAAATLLLVFGIAYFSVPVAEVAVAQRGTAVAAVYGSIRIEPTLVLPIRAQNAGIVRLADPLAAGRGALGRAFQKGELLATIADETTARLLKQARTDLKAASDRAALPLPSEEQLKAAEDNLQRMQKLTSLSNVPVVELEKARSDVNRLRGAVETERIERDRNLAALDEGTKKLEAQMRNTEIRSPIDGILTEIKSLDAEVVTEGSQMFTVASRKTYVRGEVNEEDVGEVKPGMKALVELYAYPARSFTGRVAAVLPAADPDTQRYTIVLDMENPPDNLMAGMTGEMNVITGKHENAVLVPTRALLVDQALLVQAGTLRKRTVKVGYRTLEVSEVMDGVAPNDHVVVADQEKLRPGRFVRQRIVEMPKPRNVP